MPNNAYNLLKLIRNATYSYLRANSLDKKIISTLGIAEGAVSALAIVKSDGTVVISGDQFATIGASTTALTGALTVGDSTTPSITTLSGKTNTGFLSILGKTSGGIKVLPADASGYLITLTNTTQTVGVVSLTIPDFANVADTFVFVTKSATLANKTLTSPVIGTGLTASGSAANTFAGSTGTFITSTGLNTLSGKVALKVVAAPVAATGAAGGVAGAAALGSANIVTVSSDGATKGVKLLTGVAGDIVHVLNTSSTACNLFAASGGTINAGSADVGCAIPASKGVKAVCTAADTWTVFDLAAHAGAAA